MGRVLDCNRIYVIWRLKWGSGGSREQVKREHGGGGKKLACNMRGNLRKSCYFANVKKGRPCLPACTGRQDSLQTLSLTTNLQENALCICLELASLWRPALVSYTMLLFCSQGDNEYPVVLWVLGEEMVISTRMYLIPTSPKDPVYVQDQCCYDLSNTT